MTLEARIYMLLSRKNSYAAVVWKDKFPSSSIQTLYAEKWNLTYSGERFLHRRYLLQ